MRTITNITPLYMQQNEIYIARSRSIHSMECSKNSTICKCEMSTKHGRLFFCFSSSRDALMNPFFVLPTETFDLRSFQFGIVCTLNSIQFNSKSTYVDNPFASDVSLVNFGVFRESWYAYAFFFIRLHSIIYLLNEENA